MEPQPINPTPMQPNQSVSVENIQPPQPIQPAPTTPTQPVVALPQPLQTPSPALQPIQNPLPQQPQQSPPAYENIYTEICTEIMREQAGIISTRLALEQVTDIEGLHVDPVTLHCTVTGDGSKVINDIVSKFSGFFGHAAVEVCREAAARFLVNLSPDQTPQLLK